jgi:hypothetical protein
MASKQQQRSDIFKVRDPFAVAGEDGFPRPYPVGTLVAGDDPIATSHIDYLERVDLHPVEKATAAPGERRTLRLPSGLSVGEATRGRRDAALNQGEAMAHNVPPSDPNSLASPFAPFQPSAGVVADDVPDEQNAAGGVKAADYSGPDGGDAEVLENAQVAKSEAAGVTPETASGGTRNPDAPAPKVDTSNSK